MTWSLCQTDMALWRKPGGRIGPFLCPSVHSQSEDEPRECTSVLSETADLHFPFGAHDSSSRKHARLSYGSVDTALH
jgi:hypothetical protein